MCMMTTSWGNICTRYFSWSIYTKISWRCGNFYKYVNGDLFRVDLDPVRIWATVLTVFDVSANKWFSLQHGNFYWHLVTLINTISCNMPSIPDIWNISQIIQRFQFFCYYSNNAPNKPFSFKQWRHKLMCREQNFKRHYLCNSLNCISYRVQFGSQISTFSNHLLQYWFPFLTTRLLSCKSS